MHKSNKPMQKLNHLTIQIPEQLHKDLKQAALSKNMTQREIVENLITDFLDEIKSKGKF